LEKVGVGVNWTIEPATIGNLIKVMDNFPNILHISCHGDFEKDASQEFFLAFEDGDKLGHLFKLTSNKLREYLSMIETITPRIVVLSA
jgi:CHAT domain-containing protein